MLRQLVSLQHADTAFPSGGFAFSNGIEGLASLPQPFDRVALRNFIEAQLSFRWAGTDRRALVHAHRAAGDLERLAAIDRALEEATLAEPFRTASRRGGRALLTTHVRLATPGAAAMTAGVSAHRMLGHLATVQGSLWQALGLSEDDAAAMAGYQAVAGMVSAAVRLGRVGAIEAQGVIRDMLPTLDRLLGVPIDIDTPLKLRSFAPFADIVAMRSAASSARLFSN